MRFVGDTNAPYGSSVLKHPLRTVGRYLVDVSYATTVTGSKGPIPMEDHVLLVLIDNDGTLLADSLYYL